jgi:Cytochrome C and Quinol oxidase polypeptide I
VAAGEGRFWNTWSRGAPRPQDGQGLPRLPPGSKSAAAVDDDALASNASDGRFAQGLQTAARSNSTRQRIEVRGPVRAGRRVWAGGCRESFAFFLVGGLMALLMRGELGYPGLQFLSPEQYNQLFTMHGTVMMLLYATPNVFGFANVVLPLQIGAPDAASLG